MNWRERFGQLDATRALVTGGAGFIGSHLAHALVQCGCEVTVLDDLSGGYRENVPDGASLVEASITNTGAVESAVQGAHFVFHQAAMVSVPESVAKPAECIERNVLATQKLCDLAANHGVRRIMLAASAAAYGGEPSLPSTEADAPDCWSPYAASKLAGEAILRSTALNSNTDTVSLRYFNIFGPRQDPSSAYAAVIAAFAKRLLTGQEPTVNGDGTQSRDFTYIDNVVLANLLAATHDGPLRGDVANIGTGRSTTLLDLLRSMGKALGIEASWSHGPSRAGDVMHSRADITRARELLGYEPIVDLDEGIARTLEWARGAWA